MTSATAFSGLVWLMVRPEDATAGVVTDAVGVGVLEPPPNTAYAIAAASAARTTATSGSMRRSRRSAFMGAQEVGHGVTFTIAAGVEELVAAEVEAGVVAPVGEVALAVPVSPWLAGSV